MDITSQRSIKPINTCWHFETLPRSTKKALDFLSTEKWLEKAEWYLAGGTALTLLAGHRRSVDLDFFTIQCDFNEKNYLLIL